MFTLWYQERVEEPAPFPLCSSSLILLFLFLCVLVRSCFFLASSSVKNNDPESKVSEVNVFKDPSGDPSSAYYLHPGDNPGICCQRTNWNLLTTVLTCQSAMILCLKHGKGVMRWSCLRSIAPCLHKLPKAWFT